jgi:hypothetical protein
VQGALLQIKAELAARREKRGIVEEKQKVKVLGKVVVGRTRGLYPLD